MLFYYFWSCCQGKFQILIDLGQIHESMKGSLFENKSKFSIDIICGCIQLRFGRVGEKMFASRDNGMKAGNVLLKYIDEHYQLKNLFADLIQLQSISNSPIWFKAATSKLLSRSFKKPNSFNVKL